MSTETILWSIGLAAWLFMTVGDVDMYLESRETVRLRLVLADCSVVIFLTRLILASLVGVP